MFRGGTSEDAGANSAGLTLMLVAYTLGARLGIPERTPDTLRLGPDAALEHRCDQERDRQNNFG